VDGCIELEHILSFADENREVLLLMAALVEQQNGGVLCKQFDRGRLFRCQRLSKKVQQLITLVSVLA
jgi:hypothetical protein